MKKLMLFLPVILAFLSSAYAFAGRTEVNIRTDTHGGGVSMPRIPLVRCFADKEAGCVEFHLSSRLGEVEITIVDSFGITVDQIIVNTAIGNIATLAILDAQESYTVRVEGEKYVGEGYVE